ncbi:iron-containing alcohol dehydrogenase [Iodobacter ciconiae]|uniref:Iron-containing alcohol dehydrogenase n=1 Tax=Iodobacter ciconiae TaxID=2496266 RepID=A0A3S8ZSD5_9NEIS|nr:iron-containing alcohol dehydrogenase [Iodobacter ciconiae]AZN36386.1 iron-containing alcohol dehydrogenase [Iodobacter ciconiae]
MQNFSFHAPTRIHFGQGQVAQLAVEIPAASRVLLVYGGGSIKQNGVYQQVMVALSQHEVFEFAGVEANPEYETLMRAAAQAKVAKVDWVLAVGGGSVIDGAKFIAAAALLDEEIDPWLIVGNRTPIRCALPIAVVLTLPATGAESNFASVISRRATQDKMSFKNAMVFPRCAVLDPALTLSLPSRQISNGVVDAFIHTTEQYLTFPAEARLQDRLAEGILSTLIEVGPVTLAHPDDINARANYMWCANQALFGLVGVGQPQDWVSHAIGHELTTLYDMDHAQTLAVVLPSLLRYCFDDKLLKLAQYGRRVWGFSGSDHEVAHAAIHATVDFFEQMGLPTHLAAYGLNADEVALAVGNLLPKHKAFPLGERGRLTLADCMAIVRMAK